MSAQGSHSDYEIRLEELFDRLFAIGLSDAEQQELWSAAVADKGLMQRYVQLVHMREGLPYLLSQSTADAPMDGAATKVHLAVPPGEDGTYRAISSFLARRWSMMFAVAVSLAFVLGAVGQFAVSQWPGRDLQIAIKDSPRQLHTVSGASALRLSRHSALGRLTGMSPEASAEGVLTAMQVGQELHCGEVIQLSDGFVRVRLESGPELIVEGPAEFSLLGESLIFVRIGRVSVLQAKVLTLQSPLITADCRNAKVAFVADNELSATLFVLAGEASTSTTAQETIASEQLRVIHAQEGLAAHATADGHVSVMGSPFPHGVALSWEDVEKRFTPYQQMVLKDRPLAYWPLDRVRRNRRVLDLSQNGFDGLAIGNWPMESAEATDPENGTYFNGESYVEPDHKPPVDLLTGFSVEAWAKVAGGPEYQSVFTSRWVLESNTPEQQCFGFTLYAGKDDCWEFWTGNGRLGQVWDQLISTTQVDRERWTHVVAAFVPTGKYDESIVEGKVSIYVNGRLIAEAVHEVSRTDFQWPARIGAAEFVPKNLTSWLFKGYLKDVAIYDYPLSVEEVENHLRIGRRDEEQLISLRGVSDEFAGPLATEI